MSVDELSWNRNLWRENGIFFLRRRHSEISWRIFLPPPKTWRQVSTYAQFCNSIMKPTKLHGYFSISIPIPVYPPIFCHIFSLVSSFSPSTVADGESAAGRARDIPVLSFSLDKAAEQRRWCTREQTTNPYGFVWRTPAVDTVRLS